MKRKLSQSKRRFTVIINYLSLLLALALFYFGKQQGWSGLVTGAEIMILAIALISFIYLHIGTGLWSLVHAKAERLDEREIQITRDSLHHAYGIFAVLALVVVFLNALSIGGGESFDMLIFASLLYTAHTLPSSIIAWKEREV